MEEVHDFIVIGSGCTGAMAAQTLVEGGANTVMIDVGNSDNHYKNIIPKNNFQSIRENEEGQHRYFLGDKFESIDWDKIGTAAQLTPSRQFLIKDIAKFLPFISTNFSPLESLAYGGLGSGWGLGCCVYSKPELEKAGLDEKKMEDSYQIIEKRIGISGEKDDVYKYTLNHLENFQKAPELDTNARQLYEKYLLKKGIINRKGFFMGRPALALLTEDKEERKKTGYYDMDFYSDFGMSAYRPWITIEQLKKKNNFQYRNNHFVVKVEEKPYGVDIIYYDTENNLRQTISGKKIILASGTIGSARILLRSFNSSAQLPFLCNPYTYIPCLQLSMRGKNTEPNRNGFAQLSMFYDYSNNNLNVSMASIYSYRSLMLFRILKEMPINFSDARIFLQYILSGMVICGIHHPEEYSEKNAIDLVKDSNSFTGDKLHFNYSLSEKRKEEINLIEKKFIWALRKLGCYPLKRINPGMGSSIHYAGTLPFSNEEKPFTLSVEGKLHGTKNIFVADGSGFKYLPAKGLTFSLMANAHLVAKNVLKNE